MLLELHENESSGPRLKENKEEEEGKMVGKEKAHQLKLLSPLKKREYDLDTLPVKQTFPKVGTFNILSRLVFSQRFSYYQNANNGQVGAARKAKVLVGETFDA